MLFLLMIRTISRERKTLCLKSEIQQYTFKSLTDAVGGCGDEQCPQAWTETTKVVHWPVFSRTSFENIGNAMLRVPSLKRNAELAHPRQEAQ